MGSWFSAESSSGSDASDDDHSEPTEYCALPDEGTPDPSAIRVAILGHSGAGKSSLVNALCGFEAGDPEAAATGVTECTSCVTAYDPPWCARLKIYDTPGFGTPLRPSDDSLSGLRLDQYHAFVVVSHSRFTEHEMNLVTQLTRRAKQFCVVHTKTDVSVENDRDDNPARHREADVLSRISTFYRQQLADAGCRNSQLFLVSSRKRALWQLDELKLYLSSLCV